MKKVYLTLLTALSTLPLLAQQLPDPGFEKNWVTCYPWTSDKNYNGAKDKSQGTTHPDWTVSNTIGTGGSFLSGATTIAQRVSGKDGYAIKVANTSTIMSKIIPGYFTLGTPWSTSVMTSNMDGGTFGGIAFTYRPDALQFDYVSTGSDRPTIVAYGWKGQFVQKDVPACIVASGTPKKVDMVNRERNILDITPNFGGAITSSGTTIFTLNDHSTLNATQSSWETVTLPFTYAEGVTDNPEMINVIFAAGDYFTTSPKDNNSITVDNVKLIYYSRLEGMKINGTKVGGFDPDKYEYIVYTETIPVESAFISYYLGDSNSQTSTVTVDKENLKATVTVTNVTGEADVDGKTSHTYTFNFVLGKAYNGTISIKQDENGLVPEDTDVKNSRIYIIPETDETCTLALPNFSLDGTDGGVVGDIIVNGINKTVDAATGVTTLSGTMSGITLLGGTLETTVTIEGTINPDGQSHIKISVVVTNMNNLPLEVEFNSNPVNIYYGFVTVGEIEGMENTPFAVDGSVHIQDNGDGTCNFSLPNFSLDGTDAGVIGDISVQNVEMTEIAGGMRYVGSAKGITLMGGGIIANAEVEGTIDELGVARMSIHVKWIMDPENDPDGLVSSLPIEVMFNGNMIVTGIDDVIADQDELNAPVEYYNIQGMKVNGSNLAPGFYIRKQGSQTEKILVK